MTELAEIFDELGLTQYLDSFLEHGFDTWDTILDITEPDFDVLGVKLGHRRKLQRRIAATRGISNAQALSSPKRSTPSLDDKQSEESKGATPRSEGRESNSSTQPSGKRKYRRHPKPDENAPERPPSAYVIFSNKMREDLKGRSLSFTEIAKLVGENWQNLAPSEKEPYEQQAFTAKEKYTIELSEYRQTESYRAYSEYLMDFKAKQLQLQESSQEALNENSKRPKLQNLASTSSTSTTTTKSSNTSSLSRDTSQDSRTRAPSLGPISGPWFSSDSSLQVTLATSTKAQTSPGGPSTTLPAYRDTVIGPNPQTLAWRDQSRPPDPAIHVYNRPNETKLSQSGILNATDTTTTFGQAFHSQPRTSLGTFTPPPLTSDSTISTQQSTASSTAADSRQQSTYFAPRIPLNPSRDRPSFPMHPIFSGSKQGSFDTQLPPIRHPSLSPQLPPSMSYNSPSGILATDYSSITQASQRGDYFSPTRKQRPSQPLPLQLRNTPSTDEDNGPLDPVSALLRAGEIVNSQRHHQQQQQQERGQGQGQNQYPQDLQSQPPR